MAVHEETITVGATRPELRSIPERRSVPYPDSNQPGRSSATVAGSVAVVIGAWGGIAPYVGHALHYSADGTTTWTWDLQHGLLSLLPGAMAVVGGALLVARAWVRRERVPALHTLGVLGA